MKVMEWNIQSGGGNRVGQICNSIAEYSPDIVILTEFRHGKNKEPLKQLLRIQGFSDFATHSKPDEKLNTILIASKVQIQRIQEFPVLGVNTHRVLEIEVEGLNILAYYFPQKNEKRPVFEFLIGLAEVRKEKPCIWIGDLNTGKHYQDEKQATFYCSEYISKLEAVGLFDTWRHFHGTEKEYTWYSTAGNGFRIDHAFATESLREQLVSCSYLHREREQGISDHSIMLIELKGGIGTQTEKRTATLIFSQPSEKGEKTMNQFERDPNYIKWHQNLTKKGLDERFHHYLQAAEKFNFTIKYFSSRSVSLFHEGTPIVALHPATSRADSGLWIGYCVTNCNWKFKVELLKDVLPEDFANKLIDQHGKEWRFGAFKSDEEVTCFLERLYRLLKGLKVS